MTAAVAKATWITAALTVEFLKNAHFMRLPGKNYRITVFPVAICIYTESFEKLAEYVIDKVVR